MKRGPPRSLIHSTYLPSTLPCHSCKSLLRIRGITHPNIEMICNQHKEHSCFSTQQKEFREREKQTMLPHVIGVHNDVIIIMFFQAYSSQVYIQIKLSALKNCLSY